MTEASRSWGGGTSVTFRKLGRSGIEVSAVGLGCMSLGVDRSRAQGIIRRALDLGVTLFDTADLYDHGVNEEIVGETLRGVRDKVVIATKVGNRWRADGSGWDWDPSAEYILREVHESLRRLRTDYIDLYQLHGGTIEDPAEETVQAFERLLKEGAIRAWGISSIRPNVVRRYAAMAENGTAGLTSEMVQYSMLDRRPEEEILENARRCRVRRPGARGGCQRVACGEASRGEARGGVPRPGGLGGAGGPGGASHGLRARRDAGADGAPVRAEPSRRDHRGSRRQQRRTGGSQRRRGGCSVAEPGRPARPAGCGPSASLREPSVG